MDDRAAALDLNALTRTRGSFGGRARAFPAAAGDAPAGTELLHPDIFGCEFGSRGAADGVLVGLDLASLLRLVLLFRELTP